MVRRPRGHSRLLRRRWGTRGGAGGRAHPGRRWSRSDTANYGTSFAPRTGLARARRVAAHLGVRPRRPPGSRASGHSARGRLGDGARRGGGTRPRRRGKPLPAAAARSCLGSGGAWSSPCRRPLTAPLPGAYQRGASATNGGTRAVVAWPGKATKMGLEFRILGPLEVCGEEGPLRLGGRRERVALAVLLLNANRRVSSDELGAALWGELPPATAANAIQVVVSRLRKLVARDAALRTERGGYVLR